MTRLRKRGTRLKERPSLADYIKTRCSIHTNAELVVQR